jgi:hypothetical protein
MRFVDREGKEVPNGTKCLAVHDNGDGTITVYRKSEDDLKALIADMKTAGKSGTKITTDYWKICLA